jgi:hypothetical protein
VCIMYINPALVTIMKEMNEGLTDSRRKSLFNAASVLTFVAIFIDFAVFIFKDKVENVFEINPEFQERIHKCRGDSLPIDAHEVAWGNFW